MTNEMARLANCPVPIIPKIDPEKGLYLVFLNAQSLRLHLEDIIVDERFTNAHVLRDRSHLSIFLLSALSRQQGGEGVRQNP